MPKLPAFAFSALLVVLLLLGGVGALAYAYRDNLRGSAPSRVVVAPTVSPSSTPVLKIIPAPPQVPVASISTITPTPRVATGDALPTSGPELELAGIGVILATALGVGYVLNLQRKLRRAADGMGR